MLQVYTIPAGGRLINASGAYFRVESVRAAPGQSSVFRVRADGQDLGEYLPGDAVHLPIAASVWEIVPASPTATGTVRVGVAGVESSRIFGQVEVIDSDADRTLEGNSFYASNAAGANSFVSVVCLNANGATVAISKIYVGSATAGSFLMGFSTGIGTANPNAATMQNKRFGGRASVCQTGASALMVSATPTAVEIPGYTQFVRPFVRANETLVIDLKQPLVITGTEGLVVQGAVTNRDLSVAFEVEEIS